MNRVALRTIVIASAFVALATGCVAPEKTTSGNSLAAGSSAITTPTRSKVAPPTPADFIVGVIITEQKCFGSAGCNYHYTINPQYISAKPLPDKTTVVFTVTGGDQDQVGNFTIDASGTATFDRETSISGQENANLKATVTQVIPGR
ncbi:hypothetical protein OS121_23385 [Mycolicibacterium mucogenicum]|uniref:hypothetical protein n=1 Tax=Mycolicibacterium mucogenicum TaxID=56689 RepID=UPI00226AD985|nr:hypothetical protein [Mycolicibacterium mucogenicum]MCX8557996.1 hypothetical protein [Mycolicibacterium mucogenicum]